MQLKTLLFSIILALAGLAASSVYAQSSSYVLYRTSDRNLVTRPLYGDCMTSSSTTILRQTSSLGSVVVSPRAITPRSLVSTVHVYQPFTNDAPSSHSPVVRRIGARNSDDDDDFGFGGATDGNVGDGGTQSTESPLGSPIILALFALAYGVFLYSKKHQTNQRVQRIK